VITVALSLVLVLAANLDAIRLFRMLSTDAQVRAQLSSSADAIMKQAASLTRTREDGAGRGTVPDVYRKAMVDVLQSASAGEQSKSNPRNSSKAKLPPSDADNSAANPAENRATMEAKARANNTLVTTPAFASREQAVSWLRGTLKADPAVENLIANYQLAVNAQIVSDGDKLLDHSASLQYDLAHSELQLFPEKWPGWNPTGNELPGLLVALALLCLGVPICYNLLRTVASLRPLALTGVSIHPDRRIRREDRRYPQAREQARPRIKAQVTAAEKTNDEKEPVSAGNVDRLP